MKPSERLNGVRHLKNGLAIFGAGALFVSSWRIALALGGAPTHYRVDRRRLPSIESEEFLRYISTITDSQVQNTTISILQNGGNFYAAELEAIRSARRTINLEAYEFFVGDVTRDVLSSLAVRARSGVEVRMVIDAIGSLSTPSSYFKELRSAGGQMAWYHPVNSTQWPYLNHRTHRKLLTIDGKVGFIGGADYADHWLKATKEGPRWRDTVLKIEGESVSALNSVFAENWIETTGEILAGPEQFSAAASESGVPAMIVTSTPHGGTTRARTLFQTLLEGANKSIHITTPYFVPDRSARKALLRAARDRGVDVKILSVGPHSDHAMTRRLSRAFDKSLAAAGAKIYEYQPAMIHAKLMTIDGLWTVAGSTNFDHRSFDLNDEVNIVIRDEGVTAQIEEQFARDLQESRRLTLKHLDNPGLPDRIVQDVSWVLRREE